MKNISNIGIFTLLLVSSLTIMVGTVIAPSLSGITDHLNFGYPPAWLITLPALGVVVFARIIGKLLNRIGATKLLYGGLVPYAILGVSGAFMYNDYLLMLNRFLLGAATVAVQVAVTSLIADFFKGEQRMKLIAWQGMAIELGGVLFLSIGGILGEWHWTFPFYIYLMALLALLLVVKTLPKTSKRLPEFKMGQEREKGNLPKIRTIFYASILAMVLFFVSFVTLPLYLPTALNFSESATGYYMAFISLIAILSASQMPKVVNKIGDGKTISLGFLLFMLGYLCLANFSSVPLLLLTVLFIGVGFGFTIPLLNHMMIEASTDATMGKNLGLYSMGVFGGQFLSTFIDYASDDYTTIYGIASVLAMLLGSGLYFVFKKIEHNPRHTNPKPLPLE